MFLKFLHNSGLYLVILILERSLVFFTTPLLVNSISISDYGSYSLFLSFESAIMPLISLNLYSAISKEFYTDSYDFKESTFLLGIAYIVFSLVSVVLLYLFNNNISAYFSLSFDQAIIAVFTALFSSFIVYAQTFYKLQNKIVAFGIFSISQSLMYFLTFYLIVNFFSTNLLTLIYTRFLLYLIIIIAFLFITKSIKITRNFKPLFSSIKLTFPTVFFSLSAFVFVMSDRFFIAKYLGKESLGEYAATYQIPALISLVTGAFSSAWIPWLFENLKNSDHRRHVFIVRIIYLLIFLLIVCSFIFYLMIPFIGKVIFKESLILNQHYIKFLIVGFLFQGVYNLFSPFVFYSGKTKYHAYIGVAVSLISLIGNTILIPKIGLEGAALTFLFSWCALALFFFIATFFSYPMPWFYFVKLSKK